LELADFLVKPFPDSLSRKYLRIMKEVCQRVCQVRW
jgi:hypothetical protein